MTSHDQPATTALTCERPCAQPTVTLEPSPSVRPQVRTYAAEGVTWPDVAVPDNHDVLTLLAVRPMGLLPLLDDTCALAAPSDEAFCASAVQAHARSRVFARPKNKQRRRRGAAASQAADAADATKKDFVIRHFAGPVRYSCDGFVAKNADRLPAEAIVVLGAASDGLVADLFGGAAEPAAMGRGGNDARQRRGPASVCAAFEASLKELVDTLHTTRSYFVRCVRPRGGVHALEPAAAALGELRSSGALATADHAPEAPSEEVDGRVVLGQLRASGVLEAVTLLKLGFPTRLPYEEVRAARALAPRSLPRSPVLSHDPTTISRALP